jgi:hypothetical protein
MERCKVALWVNLKPLRKGTTSQAAEKLKWRVVLYQGTSKLVP